jgi:hypothetical protein
MVGWKNARWEEVVTGSIGKVLFYTEQTGKVPA